MRKVVLFNMVTLDGFFEGPGRDISWHNVDDEFNQFAIEQMAAADGLIFGRVTYELMASYLPTPAVLADDPQVAGIMNTLPKYVFSHMLETAEWSNTRLIKGNTPAEVADLKKQSGKDLLVFGSAELAASLMQDGLIDEIRLMVNPVLLGKGTPLFKRVEDRLKLRLVNARTFRNGNVLLTYQPEAR